MGGARALEWAATHPARVAGVGVMAATAASSADQIAWGQAQTAAIRLDPDFQGGDYYPGPGPVAGLGIARRIAHEKKIDLAIKRIGCVGHLDHRGIDLEADVPVPFPRIELTIEAVTSASEADMDELRRELKLRCPMSVILTQAGSVIDETWSIEHKPAA